MWPQRKGSVSTRHRRRKNFPLLAKLRPSPISAQKLSSTHSLPANPGSNPLDSAFGSPAANTTKHPRFRVQLCCSDASSSRLTTTRTTVATSRPVRTTTAAHAIPAAQALQRVCAVPCPVEVDPNHLCLYLRHRRSVSSPADSRVLAEASQGLRESQLVLNDA